MKISVKVEYGIVTLLDIALNESDGKPVTVSSISARQNLSAKYLEQVLMILRRCSLVHSTKGFKGGYVLGRSPKEITLKNVVDAMDIEVLSDVELNDKTDFTIKSVVQKSLWDPMTSYMQSYCDSITIFDLMENYRTSCSNYDNYMYYI